jgi:predicted O-methyltransferase YrrM
VAYDRVLPLTPRLRDYLLEVSLREPPLLAELRAETRRIPGSGMQISPDQGQFMGLLARLAGARRCLEIGTFTGYSALSVMLALGEDARMICCDLNPTTTAIARRYWQRAGMGERIDLRLGPAGDTLTSLIADGASGSFDFAFIDADKEGYADYYEQCLQLVRAGGLILIDNVLWGGEVADRRRHDPEVDVIRALNAKLHADQRVDLSMLAIGDGLTIARKR